MNTHSESPITSGDAISIKDAKMKPRSLGFTLLELLVVIVIIGLLASLVAPRYFDTVSKSKVKIAKAQISSLDKALEQYRLEVGSYPTKEQGLEALVVAPSGLSKWQGPYLKKAIPKDPWEHPYIYSVVSGVINITSLGADGAPGGEGEDKDISLVDID